MCTVHTSQGHTSWEIIWIFTQLSSYLLLMHKQSCAMFSRTDTNAAWSERHVIQFPLCIIVIIGRYQNASQLRYKLPHCHTQEQSNFHMNIDTRLHRERTDSNSVSSRGISPALAKWNIYTFRSVTWKSMSSSNSFCPLDSFTPFPKDWIRPRTL